MTDLRRQLLFVMPCSLLQIKYLMDKKLLDILVCPVTKGKLIYDKDKQELVSKSARLAYPIKNGTPVMLEQEARALTQEEVDGLGS